MFQAEFWLLKSFLGLKVDDTWDEFMFHLLICLYNPGSEVWEAEQGRWAGKSPKGAKCGVDGVWGAVGRL